MIDYVKHWTNMDEVWGLFFSFGQTSRKVNVIWINLRGGNCNQHNLQKGMLGLLDIYFADASRIFNVS